MSYARTALRKNKESTFTLQITSMIDMFTIILVFLLKSYSSSAVDVAPSGNLRLPASTSTQQAVEALKLVVSQTGIFVDDRQVLDFQNGVIPKQVFDTKDDKFIRPLYEALTQQAQKTKNIAKQNDSMSFEGRVILQADQSISYQTLRKVMYTATLAGFSDFKFAVVALQ